MASIKDIPQVDFIEGITLDTLESQMKAVYIKKKSEVTGKEVTLEDSDDQALILNACATYIFWGLEHIQKAGKQNMLGTSWGSALEQLGALIGVTRNPATAATTTVRFTLSAAQADATYIPAGTRVTASGSGTYFATSEYLEIPAGSLYGDVSCACTITGEAGNGFIPGTIDTLVDLIGYVASVSNVTTSAGGADTEGDADLAERIFLAPSKYSVAGPDDAYVYWAKSYNADIGDAVVTSPTPGEVDVYVTMEDGSLPEKELLTGLQKFLEDDDIRPLTDKVVVSAPEKVEYAINLKYWINASSTKQAESIRTAVDTAVSDYIRWQSVKIGRDINPDELTKRVITAGAKRVSITSPTFTETGTTQLPYLTSKTIVYGGIEDD